MILVKNTGLYWFYMTKNVTQIILIIMQNNY